MKLLAPLALLSLLLAGGCCWNADSCRETWASKDAAVGGVGGQADAGDARDASSGEGGVAGEDAMVDARAPKCSQGVPCGADEPICVNPGEASAMCSGCKMDEECKGLGGERDYCENEKCVECKTNEHCSEAKPVCDTQSRACRRCVQDSECTSGPGVCLESEGRCAKDSEVQYVDARSECAGSEAESNGGSLNKPFCAPQLAVDTALRRNRPVIILKDNDVLEPVKIALGPNNKVFLIGKGTKEPPATIKAGVAPGIDLTSGIVYVRGVVIKGGFNQGVRATGVTAELHMNRCTVQENSKGGVLVAGGAAFEISNTLVTGNGGNDNLWGGINVVAGAAPPKTAILRHVTIAGNRDLAGLACEVAIKAEGLLSYKGAQASILDTCGVSNCCDNALFTSAYKLEASTRSACANKVLPASSRDLIDVFGNLRIDAGDCGAVEFDN